MANAPADIRLYTLKNNNVFFCVEHGEDDENRAIMINPDHKAYKSTLN